MSLLNIIYSVLKVSRVTGITTTLLRRERPLSVVLPLFLEWLATTTSNVSEKTKTPHYPGMMNSIFPAFDNYIIIFLLLVLVAHNGFAFDFPILLAEVERRMELHLSDFVSRNIHFSDTLPLLRRVLLFLCLVICFICILFLLLYLVEEGWGRDPP